MEGVSGSFASGKAVRESGLDKKNEKKENIERCKKHKDEYIIELNN